MSNEPNSFTNESRLHEESKNTFASEIFGESRNENSEHTPLINSNALLNRQSTEQAQNLYKFPASEPKKDRLERILHVKNPLLEAASVLLRVLADMPSSLNRAEMNSFHQLLVDELHIFTNLCEEANIRNDHKLAARYALCSAIDEAAGEHHYGEQQTQTQSIGSWSTKALLQHFHQEGYGGKTVFLIIGRLSTNPTENIHILEVLLYILLLGFKGTYRSEIDGERNLETIKTRLYALVAASNGSNSKMLSEHSHQAAIPAAGIFRTVPLWLIALLLSLSLAAAYAWHKYIIHTQYTDIRHQIEALAKEPAVNKRLGLVELLEPEISKKLLTVTETDTKATVQIMGDQMFNSGGAILTPQSTTVIERVANAMLDVPGTVQILGHTDSISPAGAMLKNFPNNQKLSESRAEKVAAIFLRIGVPSSRIQVQGMGDTAPIANNNTADGRSKNRRVELVINY